MQPGNKPLNNTDGRTQRTIRSRRAIIEALFSLHESGNLVPTAQQVADYSGLGIRTVFRHFSEMETLAIEGDKLLHQRYSELPVTRPAGDLDQRIDQLINDRAATCEMFAPHIRATLAQAWRYRQLDLNYRKLCVQFRRQMMVFVPELEGQNDEIIEAADIALSFETWNRLRQCRDMSRKSTTSTMKRLLRAVLTDAEVAGQSASAQFQ